MFFLRFSLTHKALQLSFQFFFLFFLPFLFSGRTAKSFLANVLTLVIERTCDQELTHSFDTSKNISVKTVPVVVIFDACGTLRILCTVTSIHSIQKRTRNSQNQPPETRKQVIQIASRSDGRRFKGQNREKSS